MSDKRHNGWTNYETWRVNLEVFDGLNLRDHFDAIPSVYVVSEWAQQYAEELIDAAVCDPVGVSTRMLTPSDIVSSWARAFLGVVDWRMIASHLIENANAEAA